MRGKNEGSIFLDKQRKMYRAMYYTPCGERISKRFTRRAEASEWLALQQVSVAKNEFIERHDWNFGEWLEEFLEVYAQPRVRVKTFERYQSLIKHLKPLNHVKLQQLSGIEFQKLYNSMNTYSGETRSKVHKICKMALNQAVADHLIYSNPLMTLKAPKIERKDIEIFEQNEISVILSAPFVNNHRWKCVILVAAKGGLRISEILGLRWCDLDYEKRGININQGLHSVRGGLIVEQPKTRSSKRFVALPEFVFVELSRSKLEKQAFKDDGYIFTNLSGTPVCVHNFQRFWRTIFKNIDVPYRNFHSLRHSHATFLLSKGIPIVEVSRRLGHSKTSVTLDVYAHAMPKTADAKIIQVLEE